MDRPEFRCRCGELIPDKNITQRGSYLKSEDQPEAFIYFKFRCPRCRKMGEMFVRVQPPNTPTEPPAA